MRTCQRDQERESSASPMQIARGKMKVAARELELTRSKDSVGHGVMHVIEWAHDSAWSSIEEVLLRIPT